MTGPVLRGLGRLPLSWLHAVGTVLGWAVYWSSPSYAKRLQENLATSNLCADRASCAKVQRACIAETGKAVAELPKLWFGPATEVDRLVTCNDWAVADEGLRRGKGLILLTPHLGSFEAAGLHAARRAPLTVLYRPPRLRWLEALMEEGRRRTSAQLAPATLRGVRMLYKALQRGEAVGILPDQAPGAGEGVWAPFFGKPAYTMTLVGRLQKASGAAVVMAYAERLSGGRGYILHMTELTGPLDEASLNRAIEQAVSRLPEQYLWSYNRYKVPAGAPRPPNAAPEPTGISRGVAS